MNRTPTPVHSFIPPRSSGLPGYKNFKVTEDSIAQLEALGVFLDYSPEVIGATMDAVQASVTTPSIGVPVQFLQGWLPGIIYIITQARKIDALIGRTTVGSWEDEQIVSTYLELEGTAQFYTGYSNVPLSNYNLNYLFNTVVRFEEGIFVENLEAARASRVGVNANNTKRQAAVMMLEISRNFTGFFGVNAGAGQTYGLLNTPGQPAYIPVANGDAGSPLWSAKTTLNIIADLQAAVSQLLTQSGANLNPYDVPTTCAVATNAWTYLTTVTTLGYSVLQWAQEAFPKMRFENAPQLNTANGGAGVFYLYADEVDNPSNDYSTDDRRVFSQLVPTVFKTNGVEQKAKGVLEDFINATAGVLCKRAYGIVRFTGIS
jgi:hypothetical protein